MIKYQVATCGHLNTVPIRAALKEGFEGLETKATFYCRLHEVLYQFFRGFLPSSLFLGKFGGFCDLNVFNGEI